MGTTSRMYVVNEMEVQVCAHKEARIHEVDIKAKGSTSNRTQNYNGAQASISSTQQRMYSVPPPFMLPNSTDNNMCSILSNKFFLPTSPNQPLCLSEHGCQCIWLETTSRYMTISPTAHPPWVFLLGLYSLLCFEVHNIICFVSYLSL